MSTLPTEVHSLAEILRIKRPFDGAGEAQFIKEYLMELPGAWQDGHNNVHCQVGNDPKILFSAHTDTVHSGEGTQPIQVDIHLGTLHVGDGHKCLGADNGAGCWMLVEMIAAGVEGYYIFHRGEEKGCKGSGWVADNMPELLKRFDYAIAFDRCDQSDIITHQMGERTASQAFADSLEGILNMGLTADPTGAFTDTEQYAHIIPECTNVSVGFQDEHTSNENLDTSYIIALRDACVNADWSQLVADRDPQKFESPRGKSYLGQLGQVDYSTLKLLAQARPDLAAELLLDCQIEWDDLDALVDNNPTLAYDITTTDAHHSDPYQGYFDDWNNPDMVFSQAN